MKNSINIDAQAFMRTTVTIDDELYERAIEMAGPGFDKADLFREAVPQIQQASLPEVIDFIEREKLYGLGCGLVDLTLLASTLITPGTKLWTLDKRLSCMSEQFGVMHQSTSS